jgi:AcrR family transcriptional regulator
MCGSLGHNGILCQIACLRHDDRGRLPSGTVGRVAAETRSEDGKQPRGVHAFDLRERKRTRTRLMIQTEALRLFTEKGYLQTTVEEIADAAAISPRTFFRYFPSKEDVVMWDEYDPLALELVEARPDDEPLAETFRAVIRETLGGLYRRDPERLLTRVRLSVTVPELQARFLDEQTHGIEQLAELLEVQGKTRPDDLQLRVIGSALLAAVSVALDVWQKGGGKDDLLALLDRATDALAEGARGLRRNARRSVKARSTSAARRSAGGEA